MADILGSLSVRIGADVSEFQRGLATARRELRGFTRLGDGLKDIGQSMSTYVTLPLGLAAGAAVLAAAKMDSLRRSLNAVATADATAAGATGVEAIGLAATATEARLKELREVAKLPGLGFAEAIQGDVRLRAVGISADLSKRALLAFGNAIATTGGGKAELDRVTVQLGQLSAKGKVLAQDLRPIIEAAPAVAQALKKLYGAVDSETISDSLQKQGKSSTDFINILTTELGKLPQVTGGLNNSLENLRDAAFISLSSVGETLNKTLNIEGFANSAGDALARLSEGFAALGPGAQTFAVGLGVIAAGIGPVSLGLGTFLKLLPTIRVGLAGLVNPVTLAVAGLALLGVGAVALISKYRAMGAAVDEQAASINRLNSALPPLLARYEELKAKTTLNAAESEELLTVTGQIGELLPGVGTKHDEYGKAIEISTARIALLRMEQEKQLVQAAGQKAPLDFFIKFFTGHGDEVVSVKQKLAELKTEAADVKKKLDFANDLGLAKNSAEQSKGVQELTVQYARLNAQIKELEAGPVKPVDPPPTPPPAPEENKTLAALNKDLLENQRLLDGFGRDTETVTDRIGILEKGLISLVKNGFNANGPVVNRFAEQLRRLRQEVSPLVDLLNPNSATLQDPLKADPNKPGSKSLFDTNYKKPPTALPLRQQTDYEKGIQEQVAKADDVLFAFEDRLRAFQSTAPAILSAGFGDMAAALGTGIGQLASGASGFAEIPKVLLGILGDMSINLGKAAIGIGLTMAKIKLSFTNPFAAVAAGIALVALGTAIKGVAGGIVSGGGGGGGSFSPPSPSSYQQPAARTPTRTEQNLATVIHQIEVVMRGDQLRGTLRMATDRFGRVTGP